MKILLCKITALALLTVLFSIIIMIAPFLPNDPMHIYKQKHLLLAKPQGKQIICVGGSGTFYSISATLLEDHYKGYDAINMGFNAGLGLRFNLSEIKPHIDAGDIILLIPEYCNYDVGVDGSTMTLLAINNYPKVLKSTPWKHLKHLLCTEGQHIIPVKCLNYLNTIGSYISNSSYYSMNQNGDIILRDSPKDISRIKFSTSFVDASYRDCVKLLNEFDAFCKNRKATAMLVFPALPIPHYEHEKPQLTTLYNNLLKDIRMPILHPPEQATYPLDLFHDSEYHMNSEGREKRTLFILNCLREFYPDLNNDK